MDCSLCSFQSKQSRSYKQSVEAASINILSTEVVSEGYNPNRSTNQYAEYIPMLPILSRNCKVDAKTCEKRDVLGTVKVQLEVAQDSRRRRDGQFLCNDERIKSLKVLLADLSALDLPPTLASLPGMVTRAARLYETIKLDTIHTFDLGLSRQFSDISHKFFQKYSTMPKSKLVKISNLRI